MNPKKSNIETDPKNLDIKALRKQHRKERRKKIRLVLYILTALFLLVMWVSPSARTWYRNFVVSLVPISNYKIVELPPEPEEMGEAQGEARSISIKLLSYIYIKKIICRDNQEILKRNTAKAKEIFKNIPQRWTDEINGIAKTAGVKPEILMLGNCFLDLGLYCGGCRTVVAEAGNSLFHAHNLDWDNLGGVGNYLLTIFRVAGDENRLATVYFAFPGMIGALDVINEKGLALSFNQVGFGRGTKHTPIFMKMRKIAETCNTFEEAEKIIKNLPPGMPFNITLSHAPSGKAAVFERDQSMEVFERKIFNGIVTADNRCWGKEKMQGKCAVEDAARIRKIAGVNEVITVLRNPKVLLGCNIYSLIFDFNNNVFYLAVGEIPAANGTYRKIPLFLKK